mgnify:CR=1 FL=1
MKAQNRASLQFENLEHRTVPTIGLSIADPAPIFEGDALSDLQFTVTRSGNLESVVTVDFATEDRTAIAGLDYEARSGTLVFEAGQEVANLSVPIIGNLDDQPDRTFAVQLSNAQTPLSFQSDSTTVGDNPFHFVADQFDHDNAPDLVTADRFFSEGSELRLRDFANTTPGEGSPITFAAPDALSLSRSTDELIAADFNFGGPDLALVDRFTGAITLFENVGSSGPEFSQVFSTLSTGGVIDAIAAGDVNDDGLLDLLAVNPETAEIAVFLNEYNDEAEEIEFAEPLFYDIGTSASTLAIADLNEDGLADLMTVVGSRQNFNVVVLLNETGSGEVEPSFSEPIIVSNGANVTLVKLIDLNDDNRDDLIFARSTGELVVRLNQSSTGALTLGPEATFAIDNNLTDLAVGDFNRDGSQDLALQYAGGKTEVRLNETESGATQLSLSEGTEIHQSPGVTENLSAADFDQDGGDDLVVSSFVTEGGQRFGPGFSTQADFIVLANKTDELVFDDSEAVATILDDDEAGTVTFTGDQEAGAVFIVTAVNQTFTTTVASFTSDFEASAREFLADINWGDGTVTQGVIVDVGGEFAVRGTHTYTAETTFLVDVTVVNVERAIEATTVPSAAVVLSASQTNQIESTGFVRTPPGATQAGAETRGVRAQLVQPNRNRRALTLFVARYRNNPEAEAVQGDDFYDVRVTGADTLGSLRVTFEFKTSPENAQLLFFDPTLNRYRPVQGSPLNPASYVVDPIQKTITVVFDADSFPRLTDLRGTVFAIGLPRGATTNGNFNPAVALAADKKSSSSQFKSTPLTFRSRSRLTISLSASQDSAASGKLKSLKRSTDSDEETEQEQSQAQQLLDQMFELMGQPGDAWLELFFELPERLKSQAPTASVAPFRQSEIDQVFAADTLTPLTLAFVGGLTLTRSQSPGQIGGTENEQARTAHRRANRFPIRTHAV